jgi:hypothetical protein
MVDLLAHFAVHYASQLHWPTFPANGKRPIVAGGYKSASTDPGAVRQFWRDHPGSNIAVATGAVAWVLDIDPRHGGAEALAELEREHGALPDTVRSLTPGGGGHVYFAPSPQVTTSRGQLPGGLDVRGYGGYVIVPPSAGPDPQTRYRWEIGASPDELPLAVAPDWLVALIVQRTLHEPDGGGAIGPGQRHEFLLRRGGMLAWMGASEAAIRAELDVLNRERCRPPLPGPGPDGWHRLLPSLIRYAKRDRQARRAGARARQATAEDPAEDRTEVGPEIMMDEPDWPEPLPLEPRSVPPFPIDTLPPVLRAVVEDIAQVHQVPLDMPGVLVLGAISGLCARRLDVAIGQSHVEPLNLFCLAVGISGLRKGPALRDVLAPLRAAEARWRNDTKDERARAEERHRLAVSRLEKLRTRAAQAKTETDRTTLETEALQLAVALPAKPVEPTLLVDDRTVERLEVDLAQQDGALILASEEAGNLFAVAAGRYVRDGAVQLDTYLKSYDRGGIDVARIGRTSVRCPAPELTILTTPQPIVLEQLRNRVEFHHRGLWPRCLFTLPQGRIGNRLYRPGVHRAAIVHAAYQVLVDRVLSECPRAANGGDILHLRVTLDALEVWIAYHDQVERALGDGKRLAPIAEWGSKHPARAARLAGILHVATHRGPGTRVIAPETVNAAVRLAQYFEPHALLAYDLLAAIPELTGARTIVGWLQRERLSEFTVRQVHQALQHRFATVALLTPCLCVLEEYGYIRPLPLPISKPGRPSRRYAVHPEVVSLRRADPHAL